MKHAKCLKERRTNSADGIKDDSTKSWARKGKVPKVKEGWR